VSIEPVGEHGRRGKVSLAINCKRRRLALPLLGQQRRHLVIVRNPRSKGERSWITFHRRRGARRVRRSSRFAPRGGPRRALRSTTLRGPRADDRTGETRAEAQDVGVIVFAREMGRVTSCTTAARTPGTLLAAIEIPIPDPHTATPRSQSPEATLRPPRRRSPGSRRNPWRCRCRGRACRGPNRRASWRARSSSQSQRDLSEGDTH